jgi:hypothetical protein
MFVRNLKEIAILEWDRSKRGRGREKREQRPIMINSAYQIPKKWYISFQ